MSLSKKVTEPEPILLLGIMQRSGTNFLAYLLSLHPSIEQHPVIAEDYIVHHSNLLVQFAQEIRGKWNEQWGEMLTEDEIVQLLATSLLRNLSSEVQSERMLLRSPSAEGIHNTWRLFPQAKVIVLVRDGRDIVASGMRTFGWDLGAAAQQFNKHANEVIQLVNTYPGADILLVRYEDLYKDLDSTMTQILNFLTLDVNVYDFRVAHHAPVLGSSEQGEFDGDLDYWSPETVDTQFQPVGRWHAWSMKQRERFRWLAGSGIVTLGYESEEYRHVSLIWRIYNISCELHDNLQQTRRFLRWFWNRVSVRLRRNSSHPSFQLTRFENR